MSDVAISFAGVGKMYKIFPHRRDNLVDALGLPRIFRPGRARYNEFWALRGIDLEIRRGERLGIIGRNGAGKSTLLKLVTGNFPPTEGYLEVGGEVQALLEIGGGLHPEFTGRENIQASLGLMGLGHEELDVATDDIARFTELGRFFDQPFKTYSMGMQARLSLGIATTIKPEILIIDEVLGAGDAYFFAKSTARMEALLDSGAAVLLVSHALDQVARFCDETIWLDRGRIVMRGPTNEVIKAYEKFIRELDDRRLRARNRKSRAGAYDAFAREAHTDQLTVRVTVPPGHYCDISELVLSRDGEAEDTIFVGDAQDADSGQSASVQLDGGSWSEPVRENNTFFRRIEGSGAEGIGIATFSLWFYYPDSAYSIALRYRSDAPASVEVSRGADETSELTLTETGRWSHANVDYSSPDSDADAGATTRSRWEGVGQLSIDEVLLLDETHSESGVFEVGKPLTVRLDVLAAESGDFDVTPAALVFGTNGVVVTRNIGDEQTFALETGDRVTMDLVLEPLLLGNGAYLLSVGIYKKLDVTLTEPSEFYDYYDKSFEFHVVGNPPLHTELVRHPGVWSSATVARGIVSTSDR